ncbi:terminal beta-(1-_2)-arabinofuranosyltransferase [Pseudonocardia alaniniphila]
MSTVLQAGPAAAEPGPRPIPSARTPWTFALFGVTLLVFATLIWHRRWMSDDGLIVLRTVRQLVAGEGPVFNVGERVEANTSTLWTAILAIPGMVPWLSLNWAAVVLGLVLSVSGVGFGLDASRRLFAGGRLMIPFGALVVVSLPPFWDFGTSGLETGLIVGWLGFTWWLLVGRLVAARTGNAGRAWPLALVLGLAPLVRPDLALFGLLVAVALVALELRRGWRRLVGLAAVAVAVPLAYEVFRAGFYGLLVPSTALAKEASVARWQQGVYYLLDLIEPYRLWIPLLVLLIGVVAVLCGRRGAAPRPSGRMRLATVLVLVVPVLGAALLALYVTRVGGDFMHGRMLLPALFCLVLPVMALPFTRWTALPAIGMAVWALACVLGMRPAYDTLGPNWIANERLYYVVLVGEPNPVTSENFLDHPVAPEGVAALRDASAPSLGVAGPGDDGLRWWLFPKPADQARDTIVWLNLGVTGELAPLSTTVLDGVGLTNPIAAHATGLPDGRIGHDKDLPPEWFLADSGITGDTGFVDPGGVTAARAALACPRTQELLDSVRAPLTAQRFWDNLTGAWERTSYRYPRDPRAAAECRVAE